MPIPGTSLRRARLKKGQGGLDENRETRRVAPGAGGGLALVAELAAGLFSIGVALAAVSPDVKVTDRTYVKANGADRDATIRACSKNNRQQNEPAAAVNPLNPQKTNIITSGSNDYCTVETTDGTWAGFYRSTDGGDSWVDSLLPGYPGDKSPEGKASPLQQRGIENAGDPVQEWDNHGRLFYMGNAFNREKPQNGSVWVATYNRNASHYVRTRIVGKGTPVINGRFNDKTAIGVDRGKNSPYEGNVYAAWSIFQGIGGNNSIQFVRSTDHGRTFSNPMKISEGVLGNQFADIAVTSNGTIYITWRQFEGDRAKQEDAVVFVKSTDGGKHFTKPREITTFESFDAADFAGDPEAAERAHEQAFENADRLFGELALRRVYRRLARLRLRPVRLPERLRFLPPRQPGALDRRPEGQPEHRLRRVRRCQARHHQTVEHDVQHRPGLRDAERRAGCRLPDQDHERGQDLEQAEADQQPEEGHQFFPDINADAGRLFAIWHDSRNDPAYSLQYPPGDNGAVRDRFGFARHTVGLDTYGAASTDGGATWDVMRLSRVTQKPNYEMFGDRRVPFHGDYNYVSSVGAFAFGTWTDNRNVEPGDDPRYKGGSGFDVKQCRTKNSDGTYSEDTCPNQGGFDQYSYGTSFTPSTGQTRYRDGARLSGVPHAPGITTKKGGARAAGR